MAYQKNVSSIKIGIGAVILASFLAFLAIFLLSSNKDNKQVTTTKAQEQNQVQYAFVMVDGVEPRRSIPAYRSPDSTIKPIATYRNEALLRYIDVPGSAGWAQIVQDNYVTFSGRPLGHGNIYIQKSTATSHLQPLNLDDIQPIPNQGEKRRIDVDISKKTLTAYSKIGSAPEQAVYVFPITIGKKGYETPTGNYQIVRKRLARYMQGAEGKQYYDLPGVSFVQYFDDDGHAIHGAYWRSDFKNEGSHGCINLSNGDAKWLFRWTTPVYSSLDTQEVFGGANSTPISIH